MFQNILFAYDGSEQAHRAAVISGNLARLDKAILWIVCVVDPIPPELQGGAASQLIENRTLFGQNLLNEAVEMVGKGVEVRKELLFGRAAECIIEVAETRKCELIIMGTRGLGAVAGLVLGSKAQKVISLANCPVMVVK
jgi:nucleotide-binding universal stress UspA family protein